VGRAVKFSFLFHLLQDFQGLVNDFPDMKMKIAAKVERLAVAFKSKGLSTVEIQELELHKRELESNLKFVNAYHSKREMSSETRKRPSKIMKKTSMFMKKSSLIRKKPLGIMKIINSVKSIRTKDVDNHEQSSKTVAGGAHSRINDILTALVNDNNGNAASAYAGRLTECTVRDIRALNAVLLFSINSCILLCSLSHRQS
jgi:hypothetical protein